MYVCSRIIFYVGRLNCSKKVVNKYPLSTRSLCTLLFMRNIMNVSFNSSEKLYHRADNILKTCQIYQKNNVRTLQDLKCNFSRPLLIYITMENNEQFPAFVKKLCNFFSLDCCLSYKSIRLIRFFLNLQIFFFRGLVMKIWLR